LFLSGEANSPSRSLRGRIGAAKVHSLYDSRELTRAGRQAFLAKFKTQVDPDCELTPEERDRRARSALREHMLRLALKSLKKRAEAAK
jgi:hypothetical protein